ncbi:hypothetical protein D0A37_27660 [Microcoleus vaginatus HSN003]|nr:hypothetical protein D0A37_27660 [Microcoleus vaginatus HSN003]
MIIDLIRGITNQPQRNQTKESGFLRLLQAVTGLLGKNQVSGYPWVSPNSNKGGPNAHPTY